LLENRSQEEENVRPYLHYAGTAAHFQWNLDSSVGKGGQNSNPTDVSYIQWYYTLAAVHPNTPQVRKVVYSKVKVTGTCKGTADDPLVQAILAHQTALRHPYIDGKISVAKGDGRVAELAYFILRLGARLSDMYPQYWPRLDMIPNCPALVANAVRACVPRVSA
jgi:hypothetical protein